MMELKRVEGIDGLRAIAMTMVVAQHCNIMPFGWTGVWLFFVISGYVITRNFLNDNYAYGSTVGAYMKFMQKRFFRIVPAYVVFIILYLIFLISIGALENIKVIPFLLTFTHNWYMIFDWWPVTTVKPAYAHLWTISVEEQFYIFYPFLFLLLPRKNYINLMMALVVLGPIIRAVYSAWLATKMTDPEKLAFGVYASSFAQFDAFIIGALIANFDKHLFKSIQLVRKAQWAIFFTVLLYIAMYVHINYLNGAQGIDAIRNVVSGVLYGQSREVFVYVIVDLIAAVVLINVILDAPIARILKHPYLTYIGRISYSGYLYHALVQSLIGRVVGAEQMHAMPAGIVFLMVWSGTIIFATCSYKYLEMPIIRWSKTI